MTVQAGGNQKKARGAMPISEKIDSKSKSITKDKEGHYIMINESVHQKDRTLVDIYSSSTQTPKYIKQIY